MSRHYDEPPRAGIPRWLVAAGAVGLLVVVAGVAQAVDKRQSLSAADDGTSTSETTSDAATATQGSAASPATGTLTVTSASVTCTYPSGSDAAAELVTKLQAAIAESARQGAGRRAVAVYDWTTHVSCTYRGATTFDAGSLVKAVTAATLLWQSQREGRLLNSSEKSWAEAAVTASDDTAQASLYERAGAGDGLTAFAAAAGLTHTTPDAQARSAYTLTTASDSVRLLKVLATQSVLKKAKRDYLLGLMRSVVSSQRWGVPTKAPAGTTTAVKDAVLHDGEGWRAHSIGYVSGGGHRYAIAVLSDGNATRAAGIARVEAVAGAVQGVLS